MTDLWLPPVEGLPRPPDPEKLARGALARFKIKAPRIGMTPPNPNDRFLVNMPAWAWVDTPSPQTTGPISDTARSGPWSVKLTAKVKNLTWDWGDGTKTECGLGTAWKPGARGESPDCGHTYTKAGDYTISASAHWEVEWSGLGQSGTIPITLTSRRPMHIVTARNELVG